LLKLVKMVAIFLPRATLKPDCTTDEVGGILMPGSFATIQVHTLIQKIGPLYGGKAALYRMALSERHPPLGRIGGSLIQFVSNVRQRKIAAPFGAADPNSGCATIGARGAIGLTPQAT
jgi:hypothetical protein